jgi:alkylation response protein AidB-like acyl-CoA dehydrogenase
VDQATSWALKTERNGQRVFDDPLAQMRLAVAATHFAIAETMLLRITEQREKGKQIRHYGSMLKAFVTEAWKKNGAELINMAAPDSLFSDTPDLNYIEAGWRSSLASAIYAGSTQVHRSVVAENALGMPRSRQG